MQPAGLGEHLPGLSTGEKKLGAPALEKIVSTPYTSDDNDSEDEFWLDSSTVFSFGAVVFGDIDCCRLRPSIVFIFVFVFWFCIWCNWCCCGIGCCRLRPGNGHAMPSMLYIVHRGNRHATPGHLRGTHPQLQNYKCNAMKYIWRKYKVQYITCSIT